MPPKRKADDEPADKAAKGPKVTGDSVVVLDYGSQYTQLICRRVRELHVYSVLLPGDVDMVRIVTPGPRAAALALGRPLAGGHLSPDGSGLLPPRPCRTELRARIPRL